MTTASWRTILCLPITFWLLSTSAPAGPREVYNEVLKSTVYIRVGNSHGSGVLIDRQNRLIATAWHVVGGDSPIYAFFPDVDDNGSVVKDSEHYGKLTRNDYLSHAFRCELVSSRPQQDVALLRVPSIPEGRRAVPIAKRGPVAGDNLHIVGHPANRPLWIYSLGKVESVGPRTLEYQTSPHVTASVITLLGNTWGGNSGGPIVNDTGQLVGILSGGIQGYPDSYGIAACELKPLISTANKPTTRSLAGKYKLAPGSFGHWRKAAPSHLFETVKAIENPIDYDLAIKTIGRMGMGQIGPPSSPRACPGDLRLILGSNGVAEFNGHNAFPSSALAIWYFPAHYKGTWATTASATTIRLQSEISGPSKRIVDISYEAEVSEGVLSLKRVSANVGYPAVSFVRAESKGETAD